MPSPTIALSTASLFARPLDRTMGLASEAGYAGVEVMVTQDPVSQDPSEIRSLASKRGLDVVALHSPCLMLTRKIWGSDPLEKSRRVIRVAADAGVPLVVVHPPYRWQLDFHRWTLGSMQAEAARAGVTAAVENMFPLRIGRGAMSFHREGDGRDLHPAVVLDTSHAAVAGDDLVHTLAELGDRLRHVHLSDNAGRGRDSHLPPGEGVLDVDRFLGELVASGYGGSVTLEVDLRKRLSDEGALLRLLVSMRQGVEAELRRPPVATGRPADRW